MLVCLLIAGYLSIWTLFGMVVHLGDRLLHAAVEQSAWLEAHAWAIGAGILVLAGLYQFTPLKYACLDKGRSPLSFITEHWRRNHERTQAFRLGVHHGLFYIGCCWSPTEELSIPTHAARVAITSIRPSEAQAIAGF